MNKKQKKTVGTPKFERPVDRIFYEMDQTFATGNKIVYAVFIALAFFGVMGLIWMIPFPKLGFLVRMNMDTFLNWGSFYIAVIIYLYLRLAPTLSYAMLFTIGVMSFCIVQLEYVERDGGPAVWLVCTVLTLIGIVGASLQAKKEPTEIPPIAIWRLLTIGPIWLWSKIFALFKIKY
ncbi:MULTISPECIES: hypothetical protein [Sphingobacterium]|uniref:Uncharacterized protein n=1 Tax=Sphingobacterium chuzhouense TaxID=1742264 RepID=A0ABR7XSA9_9SPHI|nr:MULTISPECIES: hypothetical protein [Sphingobacterium]MBD1421762.1 hypothetical protein [Sphingobacterium chuzhouense]NGM65222.1 hypothetical protein [Sphingobacterium sp. SGR-19]